MTYKDLLLEKKDGIATITLNVPDKLNPLEARVTDSLFSAAEEIAKDDGVRVVIITGSGRGFCSGGDIEVMKARVKGTLKQTRYERLQRIGGLAALFPSLDKPVIAAINGVCVGAGLGLALSCDIRIASETAKFGSLFIARALSPDTAVSYFLPQMVGTSKALELMLTGELFDAREAERLGIVSRVVSPPKLMKTTQELAAKIAQQAPVAVELTKRLAWQTMLDDISRQVDWENYGLQICLQTEDHKESVLAFDEKRPQPRFKGE